MKFNSISIIYKENFFFSLLPGQNFVKRRDSHTKEAGIIANITPVNQLRRNKRGAQRCVLNNLKFKILRSVSVVVSF